MDKKIITIKNDRAQKIIKNRHPWIFSGAVENVPRDVNAGDIVSVADETGRIFAHATYNPASDITLRVINWFPGEHIDDGWFSNHIKTIAVLKEQLLKIDGLPEDKKNYRLIYSESDNIPGLIIDRFGTVFVLQLQTLFADKNRELWVKIIRELWQPSGIFEKSEVDVRKKEGLSDLPSGLLHGDLKNGCLLEEDGMKIKIDIPHGQKTGFFLDLRQARRRVEHWCRIFKIGYLQNYFGYTGSFNLYAASSGVKRIEHIDVSAHANEIAAENCRLNGFEKNVKIITSDAFDYLSETKNGTVDAVILDPPSFVKQKEKIANAVDGYQRLNALAMGKLKQGGLLFSFCCSSYIGEEDFRRILFKASTVSGSRIRIIEKTGHDVDHTYHLNFPEGRYLQGWILRKE